MFSCEFFEITLFLQNTSGGCFWNSYLTDLKMEVLHSLKEKILEEKIVFAKATW